MKLGSLRRPGRDGTLVLVSKDLRRCAPAGSVAVTLQSALDRWHDVRPALEHLARSVEAGTAPGLRPFNPRDAASPLPRAFQWVDGSVYPAHMARMSRWRGVPVPQGPCMYQGASDGFLGPCQPIPAATEDWGVDFESEVAVVSSGLPLGAGRGEAAASIALVMLCNDVSLRALIPEELAKEFGFVQSKPASAFSPVACTPDEFGDQWRDCRLHGPVLSHLNGTLFGQPDAGGMEWGFDTLLAYLARTRSVAPGTILGSGTVASEDEALGFSCISERRVAEQLATGTATTQFMRFGDRVRIEMTGPDGASLFGAIDQVLEKVGEDARAWETAS